MLVDRLADRITGTGQDRTGQERTGQEFLLHSLIQAMIWEGLVRESSLVWSGAVLSTAVQWTELVWSGDDDAVVGWIAIVRTIDHGGCWQGSAARMLTILGRLALGERRTEK